MAIMWFRRDLRIGDNPALTSALAEGEVVALFIREDLPTSSRRAAYLNASLHALNESLDGRLVIKSGEPVEVLSALSKKYGPIFTSQEFTPLAVSRAKKLNELDISYVGSPYAVSPGRVRKPDGSQYKVYTPFYKAWLAHGWRKPEVTPKDLNNLVSMKSEKLEAVAPGLPPAGEVAALKRWKEYRSSDLARYDEERNRADLNSTSGMSRFLRWGEIHPRTLLADLNQTSAHEVFRKEIAWREFYADVLHHEPHTNQNYYKPEFKKMKYDKPGKKFDAWKSGKTGYPFVDAGMRQLNEEGWMHNRLRMVVASFLIKDLHIEWQYGARYFMDQLFDADVASNAHGWQWTAGCGTDASPYYRVFNPVEQGKRFDPDGDYIKRYIPELRHLSSEEIHEPWLYLDGYSHGYPERIVDHALERHEALARLDGLKA